MYKVSAYCIAFVIACVPFSVSAATIVTPLQAPQTIVVPHTSVVSLAPAHQGTVGNALLRNLPTLFVLNTLFASSSDGFLTPGPASIQNILLLYRLFFSHNAIFGF